MTLKKGDRVRFLGYGTVGVVLRVLKDRRVSVRWTQGGKTWTKAVKIVFLERIA